MKRIVACGVVAMSLVGVSQAQTTNTAAAPAAVSGPTPWYENVKVKGDVRFRYEAINDDAKLNATKETYTRERQRIRARIGAEGKVNTDTKAGVELSTGGSDPISGNQTIGDGFGKDEMRLNLAYIDYTFTGVSPNRVVGTVGKMKNPFITLPDDLVWDGDLTPEGIAARGEYTAGMATFYGNGGYFQVQERSDQAEAALYAGQGAVKLAFNPEVNLTLGCNYYDYQSMQGYDVIDWENKSNPFGNSTTKGTISGSTTNKAWAAGFQPVMFFGRLEVWTWGRPLTFFAQELSNGDADAFDAGHMYGVTYGKANDPKTFEIGYSYAELEKDATPGFMTDSDRWGGGTDGKGHKFTGKYQILKNLQGAVSYFLDERVISNDAKTKDYDRLQLDLVASF